MVAFSVMAGWSCQIADFGLADRHRFGGVQQAQYFSTGTYTEIGDWRHYALAVPMYTHFTSPIRRYPDVIVHRLLARLLAQDPRAATQAYCPNHIGTLEHDKAEGASFHGSKPWWGRPQRLAWTKAAPLVSRFLACLCGVAWHSSLGNPLPSKPVVHGEYREDSGLQGRSRLSIQQSMSACICHKHVCACAGKLQQRQAAAAAVLEEVAAEGEDAEVVDCEPAAGPTDLASPGDPAALGSLAGMAHAVGDQKTAEATEQDMQLGASVEDGDGTNSLAAAETGDLQILADGGDVSVPDASVTVAVADRRPTTETPSGTGAVLLIDSCPPGTAAAGRPSPQGGTHKVLSCRISSL